MACLVLPNLSLGAPATPTPSEIQGFVKSAKPRDGLPAPAELALESAQFQIGASGYLRYVGASPTHHFAVSAPVPGQPEQTARRFLKEHASLFGVSGAAIDFEHLKTNHRNNRHYVRLQQTFAGLVVLGSDLTVQLNEQDGVEAVLGKFEHDLSALEDGTLSRTPRFTAAEALTLLRANLAGKAPADSVVFSPPRLAVFAPGLLSQPGGLRLIWEVVASSAQRMERNERIFTDAHTGEIFLRIPRHYEAKNRQVYDAAGTVSEPGTLARAEGSPASSVQDVNQAYTFLGDTYDFYLARHGRDSIDRFGMILSATVRLCEDDQCPWPNATWWQGRMRFGSGFATDDITAHELTHGVTENESDLWYANASGAINESFSDIWGEFVDLSNTSGNDSASARWLVGEDIGSFRNMRDPTAKSDPDRLRSPFFVPPTSNPTSENDYGGVHSNSGVNNKLCYLLTDGDTFNGQTVRGMGIPQVASLYYEVNANLLGSTADWGDLYNALRQAAVNLGWSEADRNNLQLACYAVEFAQPPTNPPPSTPPSITSQPSNTSVAQGGRADFTVTATGSAPLSYQWRFNNNLLQGVTQPTLTLFNVQSGHAGGYSVVVTNGAGSVTSSVATLTVTPPQPPPVPVRLVSVNGQAGNEVQVPIALTATGNENALGFSLLFDPALLQFVGVTPGNVPAGSTQIVNSAQAGAGRVGITVALAPAITFSAGTQQVAFARFMVAPVSSAITIPITFTDVPTTRSLSNAQGQLLPATFTAGSVTVPEPQFEGDIAPRPNGNRMVSIVDYVQMGRFVATLDTISSPSEFQRVDCAPRNTRGNGLVTVSDLVQSGRYTVGLDPLTSAAGPSTEATAAEVGGGFLPASAAVLRVVNTTVTQGQISDVPITLQSSGVENALSFSVTYDATKLGFLGALNGPAAASAALTINSNQMSLGRIGVVLALSPGQTLRAGTQPVVLLRFVASGAAGSTTVGFAGQPVPQETADAEARTLPTTYASGPMNVVSAGPALSLTRSGQLLFITWPGSAAGFSLESSVSMTGTWSPVTGVVDLGSQKLAVVSIETDRQYFRLKQP